MAGYLRRSDLRKGAVRINGNRSNQGYISAADAAALVQREPVPTMMDENTFWKLTFGEAGLSGNKGFATLGQMFTELVNQLMTGNRNAVGQIVANAFENGFSVGPDAESSVVQLYLNAPAFQAWYGKALSQAKSGQLVDPAWPFDSDIDKARAVIRVSTPKVVIALPTPVAPPAPASAPSVTQPSQAPPPPPSSATATWDPALCVGNKDSDPVWCLTSFPERYVVNAPPMQSVSTPQPPAPAPYVSMTAAPPLSTFSSPDIMPIPTVQESVPSLETDVSANLAVRSQPQYNSNRIIIIAGIAAVAAYFLFIRKKHA